MESNSDKTLVKGCLIVAAAFALGACVLIIGACYWLVSLPEGGVRLANDMEPYAVEYLEKHQVLDIGEKLIAYYDVGLNGEEAAILTDKRVIYHKKGINSFIPLQDIEDIKHYEEFGDIYEIKGKGTDMLKIQIAPWNGGPVFGSALDSAWKNAKESAQREKDSTEASSPTS